MELISVQFCIRRHRVVGLGETRAATDISRVGRLPFSYSYKPQWMTATLWKLRVLDHNDVSSVQPVEMSQFHNNMQVDAQQIQHGRAVYLRAEKQGRVALLESSDDDRKSDQEDLVRGQLEATPGHLCPGSPCSIVKCCVFTP